MRVHAFTMDRGGCFHYRIRQPLAALRRLGHYTSWGAGADFETWDAADVLVMQYNHLEDTVSRWEKWAEKSGKLCVWDADDDIFDVTQITGHGSAYDNPETLPRMKRAIAASHIVTVTTPELAEVYSQVNPNVVVLPNCIPDWLPDIPVDYPDRFTVTYTCSPSHQHDVDDFMLNVWHKHMRHHPTTVLRLYGPDKRPVNTPPLWPVETFGWQRQVDAYLSRVTGTVGIAPLAKLSFNRGKSGIKAQEYQALGIWPIVADWPQYRAVVADGGTGNLCRRPSDWIRVLDLFANAHRAFGANGLFDEVAGNRRALREYARRWTQARSVHLWAETYQKGLSEL